MFPLFFVSFFIFRIFHRERRSYTFSMADRHIYFSHVFMSVHLCTFLSVFPNLCTLHICISLITAYAGWYTVCIWIFECICCAAPDKLTSPPPFTGFGALQWFSY